MRCLVIIPSKARPRNILNNIQPFMQRLNLDYRIFVEPQDAKLYDYDNVVVMDANDRGLGYATSYAKTYAVQHDYDLIFKVDDDVKAIGSVEQDIEKILLAFQLDNVGAVVFPYAFQWYAQTKKLFSRVNKRMQTCYVIRTQLFRPSAAVSTFEDFYQYLLMRHDNYDTLFCSKHSIECVAVGSGKGGLQVFDRSEMAVKEINIFKEIDPTIQVRSKPDKPWKYEPKFTHKKYRSRPL